MCYTFKAPVAPNPWLGTREGGEAIQEHGFICWKGKVWE